MFCFIPTASLNSSIMYDNNVVIFNNLIPLDGSGETNILFNSSLILSLDIVSINEACFLILFMTSVSISKLYLTAKRIALNILKGSSLKIIEESEVVLITPFLISSIPLPVKSKTSPVETFFNKEFIVKSLLNTSSINLPSDTSGFLEPDVYDSFLGATNSNSIDGKPS